MKKTVDDSLAREFGLTSEEYARVVTIMGRMPSLTELGVFSVMWSEHCSYKSSRKWLRTLPTKAPWVIHGPGENAGVVDIGLGYAAIFKMESHNHPSFIEPYQGAATGVGGILRDVFTMGARPIANLNALRFGNPETPRTRQIIDGVVRGIGGYGNCVGVPTVGGEINFHPAYDGNPLVNAMTVGLARKDRIFLSAAAGVGNPVVYVGSRTGRDGIHGATMSSAEFDENAMAKRPTVQVGDPFIEKLLIEACLELMATDAIVAIQDMGAAGLTSSAVEMAGKGGVGIELDLDAVPQREPGMTAYEMMLSESQERMLMVLKPDRTEVARKIFEKWELDFAIIGHLTETGHIVVKHKGQVEADIPLDPLADQAPIYDRPATTPVVPEPLGPVHAPLSLDATLIKLIGSPDLASRAWVWNQYDSTVGGQTVRRPGAADAAIVKIEDTSLALAITTDCTPRYCHADPKTGGAQAVAEAWRNITATGARPLAVTDNLNFGNPEKPEIMGQFIAAIEGMGDACRALDFPVVSGNVSLYNETRQPDGSAMAILPTPAIGALGVLNDVEKAVGLGMQDGKAVVLVGETHGELGQSIWLREILGREDGPPPPVDLVAEKRNGDFVRQEILNGTVSACHDLSDGGLMVAVAEMVMASGVGCELESPDSGIRPEAFWFGEDQARYLVCVDNAADFCARAEKAGVPARLIGQSGGNDLILPSGVTISAARLVVAHEAFFPALMTR
ncbi:phosphoribosylformylglycinamidine synthase subunit PurL [Acetobacter orleanensis]|uniref:Phosphoribosylformylglycinamidine synthase subunit PurL n=1 Tax=Acetobacter orleanensis TaxID=104099 RepID=A0A4Y3TJG1_9PROT|nr:phosphoribosylformylglycinamidine synthase subunit PurL [Acetobacter orleanensis]KXV63099.1 phosphoribosylformylglycinamidine synthase [Acetobacter orleanensis]PCD80275.1 phosphoribosylformylglycinamidine synthase II [Acetobacter orleanensis]GAN68983.1 phosphoribosylformylglycinamidine synthase II [Acetobacter orleanensis JCM 7639]GBR30524.1 phosphoribosylformylglycinamidine synthase II [Acetobacter orleanensis NRIC 0473]GEB81609.1 phosphoribosylformylglycinamidine synthase subunit PurL [Ac